MGELVSFYSTDKEGVQNDDEAIVYAERHTEDGDEDGYGYTHCSWCGEEWPCTTASLLNILQRKAPNLDPEPYTFQSGRFERPDNYGDRRFNPRPEYSQDPGDYPRYGGNW